jgi:hypothetical protein
VFGSLFLHFLDNHLDSFSIERVSRRFFVIINPAGFTINWNDIFLEDDLTMIRKDVVSLENVQSRVRNDNYLLEALCGIGILIHQVNNVYELIFFIILSNDVQKRIAIDILLLFLLL